MGKTFQWRWSSCWKSTFHLFSEWHCTWLILDPLDSWTLWTLGILWWNLCPKNDHYKTLLPSVQCSSVQLLSRVWLFATPWTAAHQASPSITNSWSHPNSCALSWWCHPAISSSVVPFSSCPQSLSASEFFQWVNCSHEVAKGLEFQL